MIRCIAGSWWWNKGDKYYFYNFCRFDVIIIYRVCKKTGQNLENCLFSCSHQCARYLVVFPSYRVIQIMQLVCTDNLLIL